MRLVEHCDPALTEQILPMLRSGFPAAESEAKERASQARGAWKQITCETYGSQKAESWEAETTEAPKPEVIADLKEQLSVNQKAIDDLNQKLGLAKATANILAQNAQRIHDLTTKASMVSRIKTKNATDEKSLAKVRQQIAEAEQAALSQTAMPCPCCKAMLVVDAQSQQLIDAATLSTKSGDDGIAKLEEYRQSAAMLERAISNNQRDLAAAEDAEQQLKSLSRNEDTAVDPDDIEALTSDINELVNVRNDITGKLNDLLQQQADAANAHVKTKNAAKAHADVTAWTAIAEQMAPSGIPSNLLSQALKPFQNLLDNINALLPNWPAVGITPDMELVAAHRPYGLLSESEQWRVQAVIALALAQITGINLAVLDRFDVLDPQSRVEMMEALCDLSEQNEQLQIVMLGTLAKPAPGLPADFIQQVWMEAGVAVEPQQDKAA